MRKIVKAFDEEFEPRIKPAEKASNHAAGLFRWIGKYV
ncbi:hypothetical protein J2W76_004226 [Methylorubrum zatmanii]|nr:hypothetical protein [Methylorubrum zatmanii]MCP1552406.1 hypothetical protein [Methylorubrum extorquens]MCP1581284.1 hypothetical protein [Methylorubrum extorquens]